MRLAEFQQQFSNHLYENTSKLPKELSDTLTSQDYDPARRMRIHRNHLVFSVIEQLKTTLPKTFMLLSEDNFPFFSREFIYAHPSGSSDIRKLTGRFPEFLKSRNELLGQPWVVEVAELEAVIHKLSFLSSTEAPVLLSCKWKILDIMKAESYSEIPPFEPSFLVLSLMGGKLRCEEASEEVFHILELRAKLGAEASKLAAFNHFGFKESTIREILDFCGNNGWV